VRYIGGKSKIASALVDVIAGLAPEARVAVEPFMGGGAITAKLAQRYETVIASDAHEDLVLMWQAVLAGWVPPTDISESEYQALKSEPPSALRGFAGFGGSFGGKWFGGYARGGFNSDGSPRNHQAESARAVNRIAKSLHDGVTVSLKDYLDVEVPDGALVYCDPPYANSQGYTTGDFDSQQFWKWADKVSDRATVVVSEYTAPETWKSVWSAAKRQSITLPSQGREYRHENLFVRRGR
jgi:DNA adenine methylase